MNGNLQVMKFGGTSVGNAECIRRAAEIVARAAGEGSVVAVVSAMGGVTNRLIEAAQASAVGDIGAAGNLAETLRQQHQGAIEILVGDGDKRAQLAAELKEIIEEVTSLCRGTALLRELTPRTLDAISSAGERLSARLLASALRELGVNAAAVEATELIVTDNHSGRAEPLISETRERATARLAPLLAERSVPVVTGFIGATVDGKLTTLGRGGSDYSATILGAVLDAKEIIIWTDVDGVLTADPRLVPEARTLQEISYNEAAELAYFGAKVLHPKTLRPVSEASIPVWIRNSFLPEQNGTKITATGHPTRRGVKAITAMSNVTLITVGGRGIVGLPGVAAKTFTAAASAQANVLLISQSSSGNDICFIIDSGDAARTVAELRAAFASDLAHKEVEHITVNADIAIVAVVGERMRGTPGIAGRTFSALGRRGINIIAIAQGSSEYNVSLVVEAGEMREVVQALHSEFGLQRRASRFESVESESALASV
ncbi:MAG TPA: aspartate kinase, monofunctional class [Blastocatellia bacterium]|jgi:aspartate kinase|nr:aspartate kinase, monofunctional class [Blastocatellia bacterium]HCX28234.1 aspartate kinase, monofunctional class [Blastocatellia bacterium]